MNPTEQTTAMQRRAETVSTLRTLFESQRTAFEQVLPAHVKADRLLRVTLGAIARTPKLLECSHRSILASMLQAAALGLDPSGSLGSAYLVPFWNKKTQTNDAQLIPGYRGLIDLARRSGQIVSIEAHVVHQSDRFRCCFGLEPALEHEPSWDAAPGPLVAVYAVAKLKGGGVQSEVMTRAQVDAIRSRSQSKDSGPWVTDFEEMARKTVVKRLCKYLPLSPEMQTALELDERHDAGQSQSGIIDVPCLPDDADPDGPDGEDVPDPDEPEPPAKPKNVVDLKAQVAAKGAPEPPPQPTPEEWLAGIADARTHAALLALGKRIDAQPVAPQVTAAYAARMAELTPAKGNGKKLVQDQTTDEF